MLQVSLDLSDEQIKKLAYKARGYLREDPCKRWSTKEYREAARVAVMQMVAEEFDRDVRLPLAKQA
jgi:hypothetical protein